MTTVTIDRAVVEQAISAFEQVTAHPNSFWDCTGDAEALRAALANAERPRVRVLIDGVEHSIPKEVAGELLRLHLELKEAQAANGFKASV